MDHSQRRRCEERSGDQRGREREKRICKLLKRRRGLQAKESRWHLETGRGKEGIHPQSFQNETLSL